ncbi:hypothetical protein B0I37DRAFT_442793 [Chaetomium sp. MPI-CAGE-AT-0009]|nr:hypothetical protein B0I37DRAFT_442793 [Chaetomium sp. MPI-CAGE-AT-0009]
MASKTWSKAARCPPVAGHRHWQEGDIAFLQPYTTFSPEDRRALIDRTPEFPKGYIPVQATSHPVIILQRLSRGSTHVLITTVSAYGSGPENQYNPPWKQRQHHAKARVDFRSFAGSELATDKFPPLALRPGQAMRKPRTSWVHIQNVWVVPLTVLCRFSGVKGADVVGMTPESLGELRQHMTKRCSAWSACQMRLLAAEKSCSPGPSVVPVAAIPAAASAVVAVRPAAVVLAAALPPAAVPEAQEFPVLASTTSPAPTAVWTWAAVAGGAKSTAPLSSPPGQQKQKQWQEKDKRPWELSWRR